MLDKKLMDKNNDFKDRTGKPPVDLVTPESILGMAEVLKLGADKYGANTWQRVQNPIDTHYSALLRHLLYWKQGELDDPESGLSHIKHALTNAMFLLDHEEKYLRSKND